MKLIKCIKSGFGVRRKKWFQCHHEEEYIDGGRPVVYGDPIIYKFNKKAYYMFWIPVWVFEFEVKEFKNLNNY